MSFMQKMIDETQMPITPEHAFKERSTKFLILLSLRTIKKRTFQCKTPCMKTRNSNIHNKVIKSNPGYLLKSSLLYSWVFYLDVYFFEYFKYSIFGVSILNSPSFSNSCSNAVNDGGEVKPRSLRFTWSMKTTSSRDPNEIMAEIKKVNK